MYAFVWKKEQDFDLSLPTDFSFSLDSFLLQWLYIQANRYSDFCSLFTLLLPPFYAINSYYVSFNLPTFPCF